jgi:serine/threonine protein kinase
MAPEQASSKLTYASDLYAVGVVAFRMLTGKLPFVGQHTMEVIMAHVRKPPEKPSALRPELTPQLDAMVLSLLEKSPNQRPASADIARQVVAQLRKEAAGAPEPEPADPTVLAADETFRPFVPKQPFVLSSLQDDPEDSGEVKRTEPFKAMEDLHPSSVDVTERPQMSPFGGKPADSTLPPDAKPSRPGNETIRDTAKNPSLAANDDDDEPTVTARTKQRSEVATESAGTAAAERATELDHRVQRDEPKRGSGLIYALAGLLVLGGAAALYWFKLR